ncbi:MAG TPA: hypothetical protein VIO80_13780, partial [Candidatus Dormibacteraeota bacterium]
MATDITRMRLTRIVPGQGPAWYVWFQAVIGLTQFVIALGMLVGYHNAGSPGRIPRAEEPRS